LGNSDRDLGPPRYAGPDRGFRPALSEKTEIGAGRFIGWLDITASKFYDWRERYGKVNEHNGWVPRDFWLEDWEKQAIIGFHLKNPLEGYRRLTFMMLDADIVAVSPTSVWRVLGQAGLLSKWNGKPSKKGTGFEQPLAVHQHWHIDVSYINISGTFYYLCSILDGCSRYIVNWNLRESMTEADIEVILERAKELHPEAKPRIISDNGPQFIAKDFKEFIRISGMTHVRTSPYYPQSNGKIERWHKSLSRNFIVGCGFLVCFQTPYRALFARHQLRLELSEAKLAPLLAPLRGWGAKIPPWRRRLLPAGSHDFCREVPRVVCLALLLLRRHKPKAEGTRFPLQRSLLTLLAPLLVDLCPSVHPVLTVSQHPVYQPCEVRRHRLDRFPRPQPPA
jgi:transposase InsO family protein